MELCSIFLKETFIQKAKSEKNREQTQTQKVTVERKHENLYQ